MASVFGTLLKHTLNRLTSRLARGGRAFAIVRHVGRKSGKPYETPIIAKPVPDGLMIELGFEQVDAATGRAAFTPLQRGVLRILRRKHFVKCVGAPAM